MPAKAHQLPAPCPLCGRTTGAIQLVVMNNLRRYNGKKRPGIVFTYRYGISEVICRIKHYDKERYKLNHSKIQDSWLALSDSKQNENAKVRPYVWHPFILDSWDLKLLHPALNLVSYDIDGIRIDDIFKYPQNKHKRSITLKMSDRLAQYIRIKGWPLSRHSSIRNYLPNDDSTDRYNRRMLLEDTTEYYWKRKLTNNNSS